MRICWTGLFLIILTLCLFSLGCTEFSNPEEDSMGSPHTSPASNVTGVPLAGNVSSVKEILKQANTYANSYKTYTLADLERLKKFDVVMIEPYEMPASYVKELKEAGTLVIAYISIGEADDGRRYWRTWEPSERAPSISNISRTTVSKQDSMFIGPDPEWPGSFFVDASDETWQNIMVNEEIPYILALGGGQYDGIVMDVIDVVDEYERLPRGGEMREGMIKLIRKIKERYPFLIVIPNRGFGIADEMGPYIDGFKFEELTFRYVNDPHEAANGDYITQLDHSGIHQNQEEITNAVAIARKYQFPIFVLDHVETKPLDSTSARQGYDEARRLSELYGVRFIWYANSVDQDLPLWDFIPYSK